MMKYCLFLLPVFSLFAEEAPSAPPERPIIQNILLFVLMGSVFYLLMFRPEAKRRKTMEKMRTGLKKGDQVVMGGIIGTVDKIEGETAILRMHDGNKIKVVKAAILEVIASADPSKEEEKPS